MNSRGCCLRAWCRQDIHRVIHTRLQQQPGIQDSFDILRSRAMICAVPRLHVVYPLVKWLHLPETKQKQSMACGVYNDRWKRSTGFAFIVIQIIICFALHRCKCKANAIGSNCFQSIYCVHTVKPVLHLSDRFHDKSYDYQVQTNSTCI